jgi:MFS family permease
MPAMRIRSLLPATQLWWLCLASLCWAFGFGLGAPLASLWLQDAGHGKTVIGWNTGVYYMGIALAAVATPWLMRRWGKGCPVLGIAASAVTVALFPWGGSLLGLFALRLGNGIAGAMSLIPIETYVNHQAAPDARARNFGYYAFSIALGIALGTLAGMQLYISHPHFAFILGGLVTLAGGVVLQIAMRWPVMHPEEGDRATPLNFRANFLCFGSGWVQGFLEGGMIALLPIYLLAIGFSEDGASWLMSCTMLGVIAVQVPVAWLADRFGRQTVLLGCYAVAVGGLLVLPSLRATGPLACWLWVVAAGSAAFYPLGLALLGQRTRAPALARANAWFLGINCVGSLVGPVAAGTAMDLFGDQALFHAGEAAVVSVLLVSVVLHLLQRRSRKPLRTPGMLNYEARDDMAERRAA